MADIGPLVVKLVASAKGVAAGMREASKLVRDGAGEMATGATRAGQVVGKNLASGITTGLKAGLKYGAMGAGLGLLAGGAAGVAGFLEGSKRILDVGKAAEQTGADLASMQTITGLLGGDLDAATQTVTRFRQALMDAGEEGPLARLGLDVQTLADMPVADALGAFADQFRLLDGPVLKQREAVALFGDELGQKLLPALDAGAKEIARVRGLMKGFGADFGAGDVATAREAQKLWQQLGFLKQGFSNQVALGISPLFAELQSRFSDLSKLGLTFTWLKKTILDVAEGVAKAGGFIFEALKNPAEMLKDVWGGLFSYIKAGVWELVAIFQKGIGSAVSAIPLMKGAGASILGMAGGSADNAAAEWAAGNAAMGKTWSRFLGTGTGKFLDGLFAGARARQVAGMVPGVGPLFAGRNANDRWLEQALRVLGPGGGAGGNLGPAEELDRLQELLRSRPPGRDDLAAWADLWGDPGRAFGRGGDRVGGRRGLWSTLPLPADWLGAVGAGAAPWLARGFGGADPFAPGGPLAGMDAKKGFEVFQKLMGAHGSALQYTPTPALERGSSEAFSAIAQYQASTGDAVEAMQRLLEEANELQEAQNRIGEEIAAALRGGAVLKVKGAI